MDRDQTSQQVALPGAPNPDDAGVESYYSAFSDRRSNALLRVLTSVIWVTDPDGCFTSPQTLWTNYTGQSWEQQRGLGWLEAIHPEDRRTLRERMEAAKQVKGFHYSEGRLWHAATQSFRCFEARGVPILDGDGEITEWVGTCKDVEIQKRAEEALLAADRQKDQFIAILAHELRNPLAPIRNAAAILKNRGNQDLQLRWTREVIERQVAHMSNLLDDLLDVNRIRHNKLELSKSRVTLDSVLETAVEASRPLLEKKGQHLELSILSGQLYVEADPHRLSQVFSNLLTNASKYTPPGGRVILGVRGEQGFAAVTVKDNGIGLAADMLPKVFDMFVQVNTTPGRSEGGLGIGLALAKTLTELHEGRIEARSAGLGHGSEFKVWIPLARSRARPSSHPALSRAATPLRIVVADDDADTGETLRVLLELMGHEVSLTTEGQEALGECLASKPDVALLDIGLPGLSGLDIARRLRAEAPGMFLIATTGLAQPEDVRRAQEAGFDLHCAKPVDPDELTAVLARLQPQRPPRAGGSMVR